MDSNTNNGESNMKTIEQKIAEEIEYNTCIALQTLRRNGIFPQGTRVTYSLDVNFYGEPRRETMVTFWDRWGRTERSEVRVLIIANRYKVSRVVCWVASNRPGALETCTIDKNGDINSAVEMVRNAVQAAH
jgi:hypothetical protein